MNLKNEAKDRQDRSDALDETLEETFPASDAPANTVETGIAGPTLDDSESVIDNRSANRFELDINGDIAYLAYERKLGALHLIHTEVPPAMRHHHIGEALVRAALAAGRAQGLRIVAVCPFVQAYLRDHPTSASAI